MRLMFSVFLRRRIYAAVWAMIVACLISIAVSAFFTIREFPGTGSTLVCVIGLVIIWLAVNLCVFFGGSLLRRF